MMMKTFSTDGETRKIAHPLVYAVTAAWGQCYQTFFVRDLQIFVLS